MAVKTEGNYVGDFLHSYYSDIYCFEEVNVTVPTGANMDVTEAEVLGMPIKDNAGTWEFLRGADSASVGGFLISGPGTDGSKAAATSSGPYKALVRGPGVIISDKLPATDGSAVAFVSATILANMPNNLIARAEVAESTTQTT